MQSPDSGDGPSRRYADVTIDDGDRYVVYDTETPSAWVELTLTVEIRR